MALGLLCNRSICATNLKQLFFHKATFDVVKTSLLKSIKVNAINSHGMLETLIK